MKNKLVKITFLDHVQDGSTPITCVVYGKVLKDEKLYYQIVCWDLKNTDSDTQRRNQTTFVIVKSTITDMRVLSEGRKTPVK